MSAILGTRPYQFIAKEFAKPAGITGFAPLDILQGIWMLIKQIEENRAVIDIQYGRIVYENGNPLAMQKIQEVFVHDHAQWRGLGSIPETGYRFRESFETLDARHFEVGVEPPREHPECLCGEVLHGVKTPLEYPLFRVVCDPENPIGPCMVSIERTCHTHLKYQ